MTSSLFVCQLSDGMQAQIRTKLEKVFDYIYGGMEYLYDDWQNDKQAVVENGMRGRIHDLEEVIDVPLLVKTGKVKGNRELGM